MKTIPHIDISDNKSIESIINCKDNYCWNAIDSEYLGNWIPDLGCTSYINPSIYLSKDIANSSIKSILKHRFWDTVEKQSDHTGTKYIGILLYAYFNEKINFELKLGSYEIGRIEPNIFDNNRHLIVCKKDVLFQGEMEVFQFNAIGNGQYRIETFCLLSEIPKKFINSKPHLHDLSFTQQEISNNKFQIKIDFYTSEICKINMQLKLNNKLQQIHMPFSRLHTHIIQFNKYIEFLIYTIMITNNYGIQNKKKGKYNLGKKQKLYKSDNVKIPIEINNTKYINYSRPFTIGFPLKKGKIYKNNSLFIVQNKFIDVVQFRVTSYWKDYSAKWLICSFYLNNNDSSKNIYITNKKSQIKNHLHLIKQSGKSIFIYNSDIKLKYTKFQPLRYTLNNNKFYEFVYIKIVLSNGIEIISKNVTNLIIIEEGPIFCKLKLQIDHKHKNTIHFLSTIYLTVYKKDAIVDIKHIFEITSRDLTTKKVKNTSHVFYNSVLEDTDEKNTIVLFKSIELKFPFINSNQIYFNKKYVNFVDDFNIIQNNDLEYKINNGSTTKKYIGKLNGEFIFFSLNNILRLFIHNFWETYPKGISINQSDVIFSILPSSLSGFNLNIDDDTSHRLYYWLNKNIYHIKMGMRLTNEIQIQYSNKNFNISKKYQFFQEQPFIRTPVQYINKTKAFRKIHDSQQSLFPKYEKLMKKAINSFQDEQKALRTYGHLNFGDWYGESGYSWGNNEYDTVFCAYIEFLRGGDYKWYKWATNAVQHLINIDTVNISNDSEQIGAQAMHMPGHVGGYLPPYFKSKISGTQSIPSHTWIEGTIISYLLSGDESILDSLNKTKNWLIRPSIINYYDYSNCREAGWHLIHLCSYYEVFNDKECLNAASIIVNKVLEKRNPYGGWVRMLTESHCGCGYPRCIGEAGFMISILISGLFRYFTIKKSSKIKESIIEGVIWLIDNTFDKNTDHFRYTSCKNRTVGGGFQQTQWVLECLAFGFAISKNDKIKEYLKKSQRTIGLYPKELGHLGLGKALTQQMRYVPFIMPILKSINKL